MSRGELIRVKFQSVHKKLSVKFSNDCSKKSWSYFKLRDRFVVTSVGFSDFHQTLLKEQVI